MRTHSAKDKRGADVYQGRRRFALSKEALDSRKQRNAERRQVHRDLCFAAMLSHEIMFAEVMFVPSANGPMPWKRGMPRFKVYYSQIGFYLDDIVVGFCGRDIGKTFSMSSSIPQKMVFYQGSNAIFTSHDEAHVEPRVNEIMRVLDAHPLLCHFTDKSRGARSSGGPIFHQYMGNGYALYGISAGKSEAASGKMEAPHVNSIYIDETQEFSRWGWGKMLPAMNDRKKNAIHGASFKCFGVNSQGRIDTVFYDLAHRWKPFCQHVYRIASWLTPRYSLDKHLTNLDSYGKSVEANEFKQMIRGLTGERSKGVFPEEDYIGCIEQFQQYNCRYRYKLVNRKAWDLAGADPGRLLNNFFDEPIDYHQCIIAADYGTSAPTVIGIWFERDKHGGGTFWALYGIIKMIGILPPDQVEVVDWLNDNFHPTWISVDSTGATDYIYQTLTDPGDVRYNYKDYADRVFPAKSMGDLVVDYSETKPPDAIKSRAVTLHGQKVWSILQPAKVFQTNEIVNLMMDRRLAIPDDEQMKMEFLSLVAKEDGNFTKYSGGMGEHTISMFRSLASVLHSVFTLREREARILDDGYADVSAGEFFISGFGLGALPPTGIR